MTLLHVRVRTPVVDVHISVGVLTAMALCVLLRVLAVA